MSHSSGITLQNLSRSNNSNSNDSPHLEQSHSKSLLSSVKSFINAHEAKTPESLEELRKRLYTISDQITHKLSRLKALDSLLVKYIELEFELLYQEDSRPSQQSETAAELRILDLLQTMLFKSVRNNNEAIFKKRVLQLLSLVKSIYLVENKLIHNLVKRVSFTKCKNVATSDYDTDNSDSELNDSVFQSASPKISSFNVQQNKENNCNTKYDECIVICSDSEDEINNIEKTKSSKKIRRPVGVVTFEILDDDDDDGSPSYMISMQREVTKKCVKQEEEKTTITIEEDIIICSDSEEVQEETPAENIGVIEENLRETFNDKYEAYENMSSNFLIDPQLIYSSSNHVGGANDSNFGGPLINCLHEEEDLHNFIDSDLSDSFSDTLLCDESVNLNSRQEFEDLDIYFGNNSEEKFLPLDDNELIAEPPDFNEELLDLDKYLLDIFKSDAKSKNRKGHNKTRKKKHNRKIDKDKKENIIKIICEDIHREEKFIKSLRLNQRCKKYV